MQLQDSKIFVAGHRGMVGGALVRELQERGCNDLLLAQRSEVNLTRQDEVEAFLDKHNPDIVIVAAAKVGGIHANKTYPADFIYENLMIAANLVQGSFNSGVSRLLFLGSSCIYPREAPQPMTEDCLLTSPLESTNEAYAIAKIAGLKLCQHYRAQHGVLFHSAMPTNLYGKGDNYHPENSHVIPALLRRFHEAKLNTAPEVVVWGTGKPRREFLHVDDLAKGCLHLLEQDSPPDWVNIGSGSDLEIGELAQLVAETVGFEGKIVFDTTKPDGTPRKLMDISRLKRLGWAPQIDLASGLRDAYADFLKSLDAGAVRAA
jgi:GDP-L-fucose synthase